jgi:acetyl esterase/lipase
MGVLWWWEAASFLVARAGHPKGERMRYSYATVRFPLVIVAATAVVAMGCSSGTTESTPAAVDAPATTTSTVRTTVPATTTAVDQATTTSSVSDDGVTITKDIVFLEMGGHEYLVDMYLPAGDGPWPVVVALHGATVFKSNSILTVIAKAAAEAGMLVFAPNWVSEWPALSAEFLRSEESVLPCALAFAQQQATELGGDPSRSVVYGHSGGATSGAQWVLGPIRDLPPGCLAQTPPVTPAGAVFGDAEYFLHATWWDKAFDEDPGEMQAIAAETVDPAFWAADLPERFRIWAVTDGSFPRSFDDPWGEDGWVAQPDPDGTIRENHDELGVLEDGTISYKDEGLLLSTRLQQAGIDTTFDMLTGVHEAHTGTPEIVVAYLLDAAGDG